MTQSKLCWVLFINYLLVSDCLCHNQVYRKINELVGFIWTTASEYSTAGCSFRWTNFLSHWSCSCFKWHNVPHNHTITICHCTFCTFYKCFIKHSFIFSFLVYIRCTTIQNCAGFSYNEQVVQDNCIIITQNPTAEHSQTFTYHFDMKLFKLGILWHGKQITNLKDYCLMCIEAVLKNALLLSAFVLSSPRGSAQIFACVSSSIHDVFDVTESDYFSFRLVFQNWLCKWRKLPGWKHNVQLQVCSRLQWSSLWNPR